MPKTKREVPIGARITKAREARGVSREHLILLWARSLSTIRNWELGLTVPKGEDLVMVENWLADKPSRKVATK